jgi:hypothetical protein
MFSSQLAKEWKYKWFGFWGAEQEYEGKSYRIAERVDSTCPIEIREKIVLAAQQVSEKCGLCDELLYFSAYRSDGTWL